MKLIDNLTIFLIDNSIIIEILLINEISEIIKNTITLLFENFEHEKNLD